MAKSLLATLFLLCSSNAAAFSLSMVGGESNAAASDRRSFLSKSVGIVAGGTSILARPQKSLAAPEIITTPSGIKYAVTKQSPDKKPVVPLKGETNDVRIAWILVHPGG